MTWSENAASEGVKCGSEVSYQALGSRKEEPDSPVGLEALG